MESQTFQYISDRWSIPAFPDLDSENTLILIFAAPEFSEHFAPIDELVKHYPQSKIIGCSSAGEILGPHIYDKSISVSVMRFEKTRIEIARQAITSPENSFDAGKKLAQGLQKKDLRGIFILSEGLNVNGSDLVKGLNIPAQKNNKVVITGGLAADGSDFKKTWLIFNGKLENNAVIGVGFYGDHIEIGHASKGGWDIFGPERHITRSRKNILYELNEQPALEIYKKILGDRARDLPASGLLYPLAIRKDEHDRKSLVRTILAINEEDQSLTFAGDMPFGYLAQLMRANFDRLIVSASEAGEMLTKEILSNVDNADNNKNFLCIAISCVGRRLLLGERTEEETESALESLPQGTQQLGFYSYGEISPYSDGDCDLHNQTMTLTIFYEN